MTMNDWYEITMNNAELLEQMNAKSESETDYDEVDVKKNIKNRPNSWVRNNEYRNKTKRDLFNRKFDFKEIDELIIDPKEAEELHRYGTNPVNHLYVKKYGKIDCFHGRSIFTARGNEKIDVRRVTNKRIRKMQFDEKSDLKRFSDCKKQHSPWT